MATKSLNELAAEIHQNAVNHGWWETQREAPEILMLCVSELAEALEEYREGRTETWYACKESPDTRCHLCNPQDEYECFNYPMVESCEYRDKKPEGMYVEMVDCLIRILDYLSHENVDIDRTVAEKTAYNKTRPYRHGNKKC